MMFKDGKYVMLSFDVEEFDILQDIPLNEQVKYSLKGLLVIIEILEHYNIKATFFCTTNFALNAPDVIKRLIDKGHEIASHGCVHSNTQSKDILLSSQLLEEHFGVKIYGYRQPQMQPVNFDMLKGKYRYDASLNPTFIPGRYMNLNQPRTIFKHDILVEIPTSVTPYLRFPLFWLSLHYLPLCLYMWLVKQTLNTDGYFNTYFHPWEFIDLEAIPYNIPYIIKRNSGAEMRRRLSNLIEMMLKQQVKFVTYHKMIQIWTTQ